MNNDTSSNELIFYLLIVVIAFFAIAIIVMLIKLSTRKVSTINSPINSNENKNSFNNTERSPNAQPILEPVITNEIVQELTSNTKDSITHSTESVLEYSTLNSVPTNMFYESPIALSTFYMKYPTENSFSANFQSNSIANTIYKFHLNSNKIEATYEIHTEAVPIQEIISMVEKAIKSGCYEDNIPDSYTKMIRTLKLGTVKLENNKWIITNKALIRYE